MINTYKADPNQSSAHFILKNFVIPDIEGDFECLSGKFIYDPGNLSHAKIEASIAVKTMHTGNEVRDSQLKGKEFFNIKKYPFIKFVSKDFSIQDADVLKVRGDLTVKGITREIILNVERPADTKEPELNLAASTIINREEFKLDLGDILEIGEPLIGENIQMTMNIQLIKEKP